MTLTAGEAAFGGADEKERGGPCAGRQDTNTWKCHSVQHPGGRTKEGGERTDASRDSPEHQRSRGLRDPVQPVAGRAVPPRNVTGSVNNTKQKVHFLVVLKVCAKLRCKLKISIFYSRNLFIFFLLYPSR